jgi:hydrogenase/urease accessory protein HupE
MSARRLLALLAAALVTASSEAPVRAHDVFATNVARVFLDETSSHRYVLSIPDPGTPSLTAAPPLLPAACRAAAGVDASASRLPRLEVQCDRELVGGDVLVFPWRLSGVVAIATWRDGTTVSAFFPAAPEGVRVPLSALRAGSGPSIGLARRYLILGIEHIVFGLDHLLFVLGLLVIVRAAGPLLKTITAFTVAHSVTLGAAALGFVTVDSGAVEVAIALSIVLLAREIVTGARGASHLVHRRPWLVAFGFGLLHGFGFAGALGEIGLRAADVPLALLFFNAGVELGQLAFVAAVVVAFHVVQTARRLDVRRLQPALGYALGIVATFWLFERL